MAAKAVLLCILLVSLVIPHQANARELAHYSQNAEEKPGKFLASRGDSKGRPYKRACKYKNHCRGSPPP